MLPGARAPVVGECPGEPVALAEQRLRLSLEILAATPLLDQLRAGHEELCRRR